MTKLLEKAMKDEIKKGRYFLGAKQAMNSMKNSKLMVITQSVPDEKAKKIQEEAKNLHNKAFYCSQGHTILLNKKDNNLPNDDPCNIEMTSDKGCIPHDLIPLDSCLRKLYNSINFIKYLAYF